MRLLAPDTVLEEHRRGGSIPAFGYGGFTTSAKRGVSEADDDHDGVECHSMGATAYLNTDLGQGAARYLLGVS